MTTDRDSDHLDGGAPSPSAPSGGTEFEGAVEFAQALHRVMGTAADESARRLCWCDADFEAWPLGEVGWLSMLTRWARVGGRELVMVANDYEAVARRHPRFAAWRRDWAHMVGCWVPDETCASALPTLWIDSGGQALRVFDRDRWRGRAGFDRVDRQRGREDFDAVLQRAAPGFPAVTLGL
ncbi:MAG: hypothetical protein ABW032_02525 [Burkholderiaceae bacterium]